jgi:hypothetical protein
MQEEPVGPSALGVVGPRIPDLLAALMPQPMLQRQILRDL